MCGLLGIAYANSKMASIDAGLQRLSLEPVNLDAIKARGPDGTGHYSDAGVDFYHARLAVIDSKQTANQPIQSNRSALICNGEVYNYLELRSRLQDFTFRTTSDCETINAAYEVLGIDGFQELDGMYAFALHDAVDQTVLLHRDPVGKKPLYYHHSPGFLIFASTVSAIQKNLSVQLTADLDQLAFYMHAGYIRPTASIYREVKPVLPGELIVFDLKTGSLRTSTLTHRSNLPDSFPKEREAVLDEIESRFDAALIKRCEKLEKRVLLFSGGVDSTYIASRLKKLVGNVELISMRQPFAGLNDSPYAITAAKAIGAPLTFVGKRSGIDFDEIQRAVFRLDQPLAVTSYYFLTPLAIAARDHGNVVITGDGADEAFFGYFPIEDWRAGAPTSHSNAVQVGPRFNWPLSNTGAYTVGTCLAGHHFVKVDKATAENQMEGRCPFLDWDLNEYLRGLPSGFWSQMPGIKNVLKSLLSREGFARDFVERKKIGFTFPLRYSLLLRMPSMLRAISKHANLLQRSGIYPVVSLSVAFRGFKIFWHQYILARFLDSNPEYAESIERSLTADGSGE